MHNAPLYERLQSDIHKRRDAFQLRKTALPDSSVTIDCSTNSYLALHTNQNVQESAGALAAGCLSGNLASRLIGTYSSLYEQLESEICAWKQTESALVFNSGYAANIGILQAICQRSTEVFSDRLNHASIIDGIQLAGAKMVRYQHCDMHDLKNRLQSSTAREKVIVTDTVFSMDGDCAPLADICTLAEQYDCLVVVDEAHATGIFGDTLAGLVEAEGLSKHVDIVMGTFSKALAGLGAFVTGSNIIRQYLVNYARSLIYSTGLPHAVLAHNLAAVRYVRDHPHVGKEVLARAEYLRNRLQEMHCNTFRSTSQIIPCRLQEEQTTRDALHRLRDHHIKVPFIRPPTVPNGTSRLRFSVHAGLTEDQIDLMVAVITSSSNVGRVKEKR
jgi:8-amino-7-oxononanoate synthase